MGSTHNLAELQPLKIDPAQNDPDLLNGIDVVLASLNPDDAELYDK